MKLEYNGIVLSFVLFCFDNEGSVALESVSYNGKVCFSLIKCRLIVMNCLLFRSL